MASFSKRLKAAMEAGGFKQADLITEAQLKGAKLGKSQISQYVSGKTLPRKKVLTTLAEILEVSEEWLLGTSQEGGPRSQDNASQAGKNATSASSKDSTSSRHASVTNSKGGLSADLPDGTSAGTSASLPSDRSANSIATENSAKGTPMRSFTKSSKLDDVLYDVRGPVVDEAARMEAQGERILKLNIGNPAPFGFRTPDEVIADMRQQLTECEGYSESRGLFSARKAIMQYAQLKDIPNVKMENIYTGNGVSELIQLTMNALMDTGDEILIPKPDYPLWTACATLAGGTPVHYACDEQNEWNPDIDDIKAKITPRTKAIVIINPNNPTGALYSKEILLEIVEIARQNQLMILSDEIYDRLVMDGLEHISIASLAPDLPCVTYSGLSKSHMIAGYRIGWMILSGNLRCMQDFIFGINLLSNMRLCSNVPAQSIVQTALGGHQSVKSYVVPEGRICQQRDFIYKALNEIDGITAVKPKAAFYIFPKIDTKKFNITDDEQFALDLLHDKHVLITRGGGFNWDKPDHFRIVYLPRLSVLAECMDDLADFLSTYQQN